MAKIIFRIESNDGMKAFGVDSEALSNGVQDNWPALYDMIPKAFQIPLDAFLFALRHGPMRKLMSGVKLTKENSSAVTIGTLFRSALDGLDKANRDETGEETTKLDFTNQVLRDAYEGIFTREPSFDGPKLEQPEVPSGYIEAGATGTKDYIAE